MTRYVRRLTADRSLTYHAASCRHAQGKNGIVRVDPAEVTAAAALDLQMVRYRNKIVLLRVCRQCLPRPNLPIWPPTEEDPS
jgi:hypothetical protein